MPHAFSVLRNVSRADIRNYPFPHIVVENCLPLDTYNDLARTYPDDETILQLSGAAEKYYIRQNHRYDLCAHRALANPQSVGETWREFLRYHVSQQFFREFVALLEPELQETYPELKSRFGQKASEWTTGIRFDPAAGTAHVALDCQIGINTPAKRMSSTRSVHTDAPDELFAMLLYFRPPDDRVAGGNLEIYHWKHGVPRHFVGREIDPHDAERVGTIEYKANTLVGFINSNVSLHAVSPRAPSGISRRLVNIVGRVHRSVPEGLFATPQKSGLGAMRARIGERIGDMMNRRRGPDMFSRQRSVVSESEFKNEGSCMDERCAICGCRLHRSAGTYATPTKEGRSHATRHHYVAERFFGRSKNRKGTLTERVFPECPWGIEKHFEVFCYDCHELLLHNPVLLPDDVRRFSALVRRRDLSEDEKPDNYSRIAGRIMLLRDVIARGLSSFEKEET